MREYKLVYLNKGINFNRDKDLANADDVINQYVSAGWTLQQIISPADLGGALVGLFYKEK